jgi:hypothetical protein
MKYLKKYLRQQIKKLALRRHKYKKSADMPLNLKFAVEYIDGSLQTLMEIYAILEIKENSR